ncbi:hypothetical protein HYC85_028176 [Camellia sinensis]|uniref:Uncharacterized protein n=1 Tax=Camellia sinensis TaxID=4442 RepID=A0A7J7FUG7_CAMSI|nr:hypothetical protein HYC85_028176 [Camellia sinensis]
MDNLKVVDPCPEYSARTYFLRPQLVEFSSKGMWCDWMHSRSTADIAWRSPWLILAKMSYSMSRQPGIQLIGLTHCLFYFPFRFRHQFGHDQICPNEGIKYPTSFPIRGSYLPRYLSTWNTREFLALALTFSSILLDEYLVWLEDEEQIRLTSITETSTGMKKRRRTDT